MFTFMSWQTNALPTVARQQISPREPQPEEAARIMRAVAHSSITYLLERIYHGARADLDAILAVLDGMSRDGEDIQLHRQFIFENWERLQVRREQYRQQRGFPT